jgi:NADPH oxidase
MDISKLTSQAKTPRKQKNNDRLAVLNSIGYSVFISRGAGLVMAFDGAVLLIPVCRNLMRLVRGSWLNRFIPFDHNIYFHKATAYAMLFFVLVHVNAHYANFFAVLSNF